MRRAWLVVLLLALIWLAVLIVRRVTDPFQRELRAIHRTYASNKDEPARCDAALAEHKSRARALLFKGKITGRLFSVLEARIALQYTFTRAAFRQQRVPAAFSGPGISPAATK